MLSPLSFLCQVLWLDLWLRVAAPSGDEARLPRRFRQVLFLDVFGDAEGWDPTQDENDDDAPPNVMDGQLLGSTLAAPDPHEGSEDLDAAAQQAASQLTLVQCAVRRWRAVPDWTLSTAQREEFDRLGDKLKSWGNTLATEFERRSSPTHQPELAQVFEHELRRWQELSPEERQADPFAKCLVGPFEHDMGYETRRYHYDVESQQSLFDDQVSKVCPGSLVLALEAVDAMVQDMEAQARQLLELRITSDLRAATRRQQLAALARRERSRVRHRAPQPRGRRQGGAFPNLVSLFRPRRSSGQGSLNREQGVELLEPTPAESPPPETVRSVSAAAADGQASPEPRPAGSPRIPEQAQGSQDQTLVAMAGEHARHFVPERLPWQVLSRMTRVLQLCWLYTGIMALLKETHLYQVDYQQHPGHEGRRLQAAQQWDFQQVNVQWPHGEFFRPSSLSCNLGGDLVVGSPFAHYRTVGAPTGAGPWGLAEVDRFRLPVATAALCPAPGGAGAGATGPCLLAAPAAAGISFWSAGASTSVTLPIEGDPWRLLTGAVVDCGTVAGMLAADEAESNWCLLLVGWDGELLPVAALPLPGGPRDPPAPSSRVRPIFDAPVPPASEAQALHLEPSRGRLWALLASGDLMAWDLLGARSLGRWRPFFPDVGSATRLAAVCEDVASGTLFAVGRGPFLARASVSNLPAAL